MIKYIILLSFLSSQTYANVIHLNSGDKAPAPGYLFSEDQAQSTRIQLLDCQDLTAINTSLQKSVDIYKQNQDLYSKQTTILLDQNQKLIEAEKSSSTLSTWEKIGYFSLGIIATGLAFEAAKTVIRN